MTDIISVFVGHREFIVRIIEVCYLGQPLQTGCVTGCGVALLYYGLRVKCFVFYTVQWEIYFGITGLYSILAYVVNADIQWSVL